MSTREQRQQESGRLVVGMDPHKRSVTIEVMTGDETVLGSRRFGTDEIGFAAMRRYVSQFTTPTGPGWEGVVWAVEGILDALKCCRGVADIATAHRHERAVASDLLTP